MTGALVSMVPSFLLGVSETAEVLTAVALIVTALGVPTIVQVVVSGRRTKKIQVAQKEIATSTEQINAAVNHVGPGEPKLVERVARIEATIDAHRTEAMARFDRLEDKLDRVVGKFS